jgi:hypothetical protein
MSVSPKIEVKAETLQRLFNEGRYWQRTLTNEFTLVRVDNTVVPLPAPHLQDWKTHPEGTRRQMWEYRDMKTNQRVALVCIFVRPDGLLGGGGRPDPKVVVEKGTMYFTKGTPTRPAK